MRLPESWSDLTIKQYIDVYNILETSFDDIDKFAHIISNLSGIELNNVYAIPLTDFDAMVKRVSFIWKEMPGEGLPREIEVCGQKYSGCFEMNKKTAGQYIDFCHFLKTNNRENIHNILSIIYIPKGEKYDGDLQKARAELFYEHLTMNIAYPVYVFFCNVLTHLIKIIPDYLDKEMQTVIRMAMKEARHSPNIGAGT